MGGGGKSGGGTQTVQNNPDPWSGAKPYLIQGMDALQQTFMHGNPGSGAVNIGGNDFERGVSVPDYYPGSTVAPMSQWTQMALGQQAARGANGSPLTRAAQDQLTGTMRGDYLGPDSNPWLQQTIDTATAPVESAVNSAFSSAGRYGSGAHVGELGKAVGDTASKIAYQNYGDERNRQQQGMMWAPQLAQQDYFDINQLGTSGAALDSFNQNLINADVERYNYGQDADWRRIQDFLATVQGVAPTGSSSTTRMPSPSPFQSALGTGMGALGLLKMFGIF